MAGLAVAAIGFASSVYADPITYLPVNNNFKFKYSNEEIQITQYGQALYGIFNISQITNINNTHTYWNGNGAQSENDQLVGFFAGLTAHAPGTAGALDFTGGYLVIYDVTNGSYDPAAALNADPTNLTNRQNLLCGGGACPTPWLTAMFVPGILDSIGNTTVTLNSALAPSAPAVAQGSGYLSVADLTGVGFGIGSNNARFDSNQYTFYTAGNNPADLFLKSEFSSCVNSTDPACTADSWQVVSDDPVFARTVPEPGTLALLGMGLIGGALVRRRKIA
jgi:hypothetical protein